MWQTVINIFDLLLYVFKHLGYPSVNRLTIFCLAVMLYIPDLIRSIFAGNISAVLAKRIWRDFRTNIKPEARLPSLQLGVWSLACAEGRSSSKGRFRARYWLGCSGPLRRGTSLPWWQCRDPRLSMHDHLKQIVRLPVTFQLQSKTARR